MLYAELIGADGSQLLSALSDPSAPADLWELPAVQTLRQTWVFQYYAEEGQLRWRKAEDLPPAGLHFDSPYDPEARFGNKRSITWTGYKVHLTETCEDEEIHLITHVETTAAGITDSELSAPIHDALAKKDLLPSEHFLDSGYVDADLLVKSQRDLGIEVIGPMRPDSSWQAKADQGYDLTHFTVDWEAREVVCPQGKLNTCWTPRLDAWGTPIISVKFSRTDCRLCPARSLCTKAAESPRHVTDAESRPITRRCSGYGSYKQLLNGRPAMSAGLASREPFRKERVASDYADRATLARRKHTYNIS